jgi:hypothetical protein
MSDEIQYELEDDLREEYDLTELKNPVRGKYYQQYRKGHSVTIHREDGTTTVEHFPPVVKNNNSPADQAEPSPFIFPVVGEALPIIILLFNSFTEAVDAVTIAAPISIFATLALNCALVAYGVKSIFAIDALKTWGVTKLLPPVDIVIKLDT